MSNQAYTYVCNVCGALEADINLEINDTNMRECYQGHVYCSDHIEGVNIFALEQVKELVGDFICCEHGWGEEDDVMDMFKKTENIDTIIASIVDKSYDRHYADDGLSDVFCPLCNLREISDHDIIHYLIATKKINKEQVISEIRNKFKNSTDLSNFICKEKETAEKHSDSPYEINLDKFTNQEKALTVLFTVADVEPIFLEDKTRIDVTSCFSRLITSDYALDKWDEDFIQDLCEYYFPSCDSEEMVSLHRKHKMLKKLT